MTTTLNGEDGNKMWPHIIFVALLFAFVFMEGWLSSNRYHDRSIHTKTVTDTVRVTVYDTVRVTTPVPRDSIVLRYETIPIFVTDTIADTIFYDLPIEQKVYSDSSYTAWVSGFHPSLDSIYLNRRTEYKTIYKTTTVYQKKKRWGVGVQVGYGFAKERFDPYVGVGLSYNIISW